MLKTFSITDIGKKRTMNQDYVFTSEMPVGNLPNLFIVADGMGGHNGGEYASKYTVEVMVNVVAAAMETKPVEIFERAITTANIRVRKKALEVAELSGMGTTVVAATCIENVLHVANVGDSRLYIVGKDIRQITRDHSLVEEMVRMGGLDEESARTSEKRNIITRAIGADENVAADYFTVELKEDEIVLMCSDGLTNMLENEDIRMILSGQRDIVEKAEELVKAANNNGGMDNIAIIIIEPRNDNQSN